MISYKEFHFIFFFSTEESHHHHLWQTSRPTPFLFVCFNLTHILLPWAEVTVTQSLSPDGMLLTELKTALNKEHNHTGMTLFKPVLLAEI